MVLEQPSLFDGLEEPTLEPLEGCLERRELGSGAWLDLGRSWVRGATPLFERLVEQVPWQAERRRMYERVVDVPRLQCFYDAGAALPDPVLEAARSALSIRYAAEAGGPLETVGLNLYRDGSDSVAWHGDRIGRASSEDTVVAVVSLGAPRRFLLRPRGGGPSLSLELGPGDLLVMGGSCQRTWEHCVPKSRRTVGARLSVSLRCRGVR